MSEDSIYYEEIADECKVFETCYNSQLPLLIKGPTGCGKSQFVSFMAKKIGAPLIKVSCNEDTSASDLIGRYLIKQSETVWMDGPVTRAVRNGFIIYLDEIAEAREDVIVALHSITDHRRELYIDRTNENIVAPPSFMCIASFNPGYQQGIKELKPSTRQRFVGLQFDFPPDFAEVKIIETLTGVDKRVAEKLVKFAIKVRLQPQIGLSETVSTRLLIHAAKLIKSEVPTRRACEISIAEVLSDDAKTITALKDLIALSF